MTKIKEIDKNERPVEKLINNGPSYLSNVELLSILLNTGTNKLSSKELSEILLSKCNGIENLKNITVSKLLEIKGIGFKKAATILATLELCKRINSNSLNYNELVDSPSKVANYFYSFLKDETQEYFYCLYLDSSKKIIDKKMLFKGTINYSFVHPREIFKYAYLNNSTSIILVHNHPTGNIIPSNADIKLTNDLANLGLLHEVLIIDHIIIGKEEYFSFQENGMINEKIRN